MSTSRIVNGERPGDPDDDFSYLPSPRAVGHLAAGTEVELKKRDLLVEKFINAGFRFVPESRGAIALAIVAPYNKIDDIYRKTAKYGDTHPEIRGKQIRAYHKSLTARRSWTNLELSQLTDANGISEKDKNDPSTFTVGALTSSSSAMQVVALHELRASALARSDWSALDSDVIEKSKRDELNFMSTLDPDELTKRWSAAWISVNNEYVFWSTMVDQTEQNPKANIHIRN